MRSARRPWVPDSSEDFVQLVAGTVAATSMDDLRGSIEALAAKNEAIHDIECVNLNPATNTMSDRTRAVMHALSPRPSLGYPGDKYEMGLEAIEQIEITASELACQVFNADFAEVRLGSGALANLYAFMACSAPSDSILVPPATVAGHVTHHGPGAAGLYGLNIHEAPIDASRYTIDVDAVAALAKELSPSIITIGCSLNLSHHPVEAVREIADSVGAVLLFDAAHLSGPIAGGAWPNPLDQGAHVMTMSTYKSLAGPAGGLLVTNDATIAERVDAIAFPGLTANFDASKTAGLAMTLTDWIEFGAAHATTMVATAQALATSLDAAGIPVFATADGFTQSHAFAIDARGFGGGHAAAKHLRRANLLTCAIGLPTGTDDGLRIGTNELVRWGATVEHMDALGDLLRAALRADDPTTLAPQAAAYRAQLTEVSFCG